MPYPSTITYDTLIRGGIQCTSAFVGDESNNNIATCSRGVRIIADKSFAEVSSLVVRLWNVLAEHKKS